MRPLYTTLTRIADLSPDRDAFVPRPRDTWASGDYVAGEVVVAPLSAAVETPTGRYVPLAEGDVVVSALGRRHATLEVVGTWEAVGDDGRIEILSGGGILGRCTSRSLMLPRPAELRYLGHVERDGEALRMADFVPRVPDAGYATPTVLIVGTSMSAGKTTAARHVVRQLRRMGLRTLGAKLTGAGRLHDIQSMADAGASPIFDFVDCGLASTVVPEPVYRSALRGLLSRMATADCDVAVVEAGASPLEPYNGRAAVDGLGEAVRFRILCASDPYAVLGVMDAWEFHPDLVSGLSASTGAAIELVELLTGLPALNVRDRSQWPRLAELLRERFGSRGEAPDRLG